MISPPTDRLYKFAAIGGIALALGGGAGALKQYNETGLQEAEYFGKVAQMLAVYNRFAAQGREQITRQEEIKSPSLPADRIALLEAEMEKFRAQIPMFDKEFEEAQAAAQKQEAITRHYRKMQTIWALLAGVSIGFGLLAAYLGFRVWRANSDHEV